MSAYLTNFRLLRQPSAFVPLLMSVAALTLVIGFVAIYGVGQPGVVVREPNGAIRHDEGAAAHTWQLLMGLQVPIAAFFATKWLPRSPKQALHVLALQALAWLTAAAPVYLLGF